MPKAADALTYWRELAPKLEAFIANRRNLRAENSVLHALAVYTYAAEDLNDVAKRHHEILKKVGILLVLVEDALRAMYFAQREQSPVAVACLTRTILEVWCNLRFICHSDKPEIWADRFFRFMAVEKLIQDESRPAGPLLTEAERTEIRRLSPEWFNEQGKVRVMHWTAEQSLKTLKKLATAADLVAEYHSLYSVGSKFIHASPLLVNVYSNGQSIGSLANPSLCTQISMLATRFAMQLLREVIAFVDAPSIEKDYSLWQQEWLALIKDEQAKLGLTGAADDQTGGDSSD